MIDEFNAISEVLSKYGSKPPLIIEAGCYDGSITKLFVSMFPIAHKRYFAFECDPRNIQKIENTDFPPAATLVKKALGSADGMVDFYISDGLNENNFVYDSSSSLRKPKDVLKDWETIAFNEKISVDSITLDTFCKEQDISEIDFIWADVQGGERDIIEGGLNMIKNTKFIFFEHSENREWYEGQWTLPEMIVEMDKLGFGVYQKFSCDILFYNKNIINELG